MRPQFKTWLAYKKMGDDLSERDETEMHRLRAQVDRLRRSEQQAQQDCGLLKDILDSLPIGVTVQDGSGALVLVNDTAAAKLASVGSSLESSLGSERPAMPDAAPAPAGELPAGDRSPDAKPTEFEERTPGPAGERVWLTSCKPVRVRDEAMLLSASFDITERSRIESELARRAYYDDLTGLPNRVLMQQRIEALLHRKGGGERFALAFIDLDNFKHINDYYSHASGDALLVKVARRIGDHIRASDVLARMSGDEFLLLVDPVDNEEELRSTIKDLLSELTKPFYIDGFEILTSASIGVSIHPEHGRSYEALRRNADSAMYGVKRDAKGDAAFFDDKARQAVVDRMELEQRLRLAIRDQKFCCAFQPKVDIHSQEVEGFEVLVRWRDDDGMFQFPSTFIGLATELGLIDQITRFALAEAASAIGRLDKTFGGGLPVSINIAAKQANNPKFMTSFVDALRETGCAERFMLELTEDAFVAKGQFQTLILPMLRQIGVRVSIDDFGTGYSSLSALADITADEIKIDRSFVTAIHQRPRSQIVLKAIESLGHSLGMTIVAEGVETFEELAYLQAATRIRVAQGYYFSKPFFLDEFIARRGQAEWQDRRPAAAREHSEQRMRAAARGAPGFGQRRTY
jgi:diguanylate cyclase (GGDEF)-like protein